jgi:hypothetical protein
MKHARHLDRVRAGAQRRAAVRVMMKADRAADFFRDSPFPEQVPANPGVSEAQVKLLDPLDARCGAERSTE